MVSDEKERRGSFSAAYCGVHFSTISVFLFIQFSTANHMHELTGPTQSNTSTSCLPTTPSCVQHTKCVASYKPIDTILCTNIAWEAGGKLVFVSARMREVLVSDEYIGHLPSPR